MYRRWRSGGLWTPDAVPVALRARWYRELVTLAGSDITAWVDKWAAWGNATAPGNDPDDVAAAFFSRGRACEFDEAGGPNEYFQAGGSLAQQRVWHYPLASASGRGACRAMLVRASKDADSTLALSGSDAEAVATSGYCLRQDTNNAASRFTRLTINNSSGADMVSITTPVGSTPVDRTFAVGFAVRDGGSDYDFQLWHASLTDGVVLDFEGDFIGSPNNVDAASAERIGVRGGALSWYYTGLISEEVAILDYDYLPQLMAYLYREIVS